MALEQQLETLNTNIVKLIAVLANGGMPDAQPPATSPAPTKASKSKADKAAPPPEPQPEPQGKYPPFDGTAYLKKGGECVVVKTLGAFIDRLDNGFKIITEAAYAEATGQDKAAPPPAATLTYDADVKPLILELAKKGGREAAFEVLQALGVQKGPELQEEQYPAAVKALREQLDALPA